MHQTIRDFDREQIMRGQIPHLGYLEVVSKTAQCVVNVEEFSNSTIVSELTQDENITFENMFNINILRLSLLH